MLRIIVGKNDRKVGGPQLQPGLRVKLEVGLAASLRVRRCCLDSDHPAADSGGVGDRVRVGGPGRRLWRRHVGLGHPRTHEIEVSMHIHAYPYKRQRGTQVLIRSIHAYPLITMHYHTKPRLPKSRFCGMDNHWICMNIAWILQWIQIPENLGPKNTYK